MKLNLSTIQMEHAKTLTQRLLGKAWPPVLLRLIILTQQNSKLTPF